METTQKRVKYSGIALGIMLVTALVLVQPILAAAEEIRMIEITPPKHDVTSGETVVAGVPEFQCDFSLSITEDSAFLDSVIPDGISQNTVRNGNIIKTIHAEKERHHCALEQGDIPVIVDVTIIGEIYEDVSIKSIISKQALVVTCVKEEATGAVIGCESEVPPTSTVPVGSDCFEVLGNERLVGRVRVLNFFNSQQEMNTVNKGTIVKTVESQKEVFVCFLLDEVNAGNGGAIKKVDLVIFTEIWEDLNLLPDPVVKKEFLAFRCVTLLAEDFGTEDQTSPAKVESCQFISIEN